MSVQKESGDAESGTQSDVLKAFSVYAKELDAKHDKYERILKISRDITIESKRMIFALHGRLRSDDYNKPSKKIEDDIQKIIRHFKKIAIELEHEDPHQFLYAFAPGLEEFIEAVTLYKFMTTSNLFDLNQIKELLTHEVNTSGPESSQNGDTKKLQTFVPTIQYMLGVQDLTGELMRLCITSLSANKMDLALTATNFVKELYRAMSQIFCYNRDFPKKYNTARQSLLKMEHSVFTVGIRGSEMPSHMIENMINISEPVFE